MNNLVFSNYTTWHNTQNSLLFKRVKLFNEMPNEIEIECINKINTHRIIKQLVKLN